MVPPPDETNQETVPLSRFAPLRVVHVQLAQPLGTLTSENGRGAYAVFWLDDLPLGHCALAAEQLPVGPDELSVLAAGSVAQAVADRVYDTGFKAELPLRRPQASQEPPEFRALLETRRPLGALRSRPLPSPRHRPHTVSVVVCTRDRPDQLERCLTSLSRLSARPKQIIVVDNAPTTGRTRAVVGRFPNVMYVPEPRPGLSAARNASLAHATGELIAFTDDDVTVHPQWLVGLAAAFDRDGVEAVTGLVLAAELETPAQVAFERVIGGFNGGYRSFAFGPEYFAEMRPYGVPVWRMGAGANMAVRRQTLVELGGFDERLGAGAAGCSEDSEFWYRVLARGGECGYEPAAVVFHHHRRDIVGLETQAYEYMRGHVAALWVQFGRHGHWGNVRRALVELPAYLLRRAVTELPGSDPVKRRVLTASLAGYFRGWSEISLALTSGHRA